MRPRFVAMLEAWLGSLSALLVPTYAVMLGIGALLAAAVILDRARRAGFARRDTLSVLLVAYAAGLAGACAVPGGQAVLAWLGGGRLAAPTGLAAYGGLVGGTVGGLVVLRRLRLDAPRFLDASAPALGLGIFFARIGCFLAGCDYGRVTASSFGTTFPPGSPAFHDQLAAGLIDAGAAASLAVHPTELYEAAAGLFLFFAIDALATRASSRMRPGGAFAALVVGYAALRSLVETFRGDASRGHLGALSTAQVFAIVTTLCAVAFVLRAHAPTTPARSAS